LTTIVAVEKDGKVKFAADTRITTGWSKSDGWVSKIVHNGEVTFAAAGYLRAIQVLAYAKLSPLPEKATEDLIDRYVTLELVPAIREAFDATGADKNALAGSRVLVSLLGRVYSVHGGDGSWIRNKEGIYAVGSGADWAIGALSAGASPEEAIKIASKFDLYTNDDVRTAR